MDCSSETWRFWSRKIIKIAPALSPSAIHRWIQTKFLRNLCLAKSSVPHVRVLSDWRFIFIIPSARWNRFFKRWIKLRGNKISNFFTKKLRRSLSSEFSEGQTVTLNRNNRYWEVQLLKAYLFSLLPPVIKTIDLSH